MKGRLQPYFSELTIRDYNTYLRYARGVYRQLRVEYGLLSCTLLGHQGVVFALLSDSLAGRPATCRVEHLPGTFHWRPMMCQTKGIRMAAQVQMLMGWHQLMDQKPSEMPLGKRLFRRLIQLCLRRSFEKAVREDPSIERLICQQRAQAEVQTALRGRSYEAAAEPMSNVYGAVYALLSTEELASRKNLFFIGSCIGRAFCLLDMAERQAQDQKKNRYNVFLENGLSCEAAKENARRQAIGAVNELARAYAMLDIKLNRSLLDNIMILGLRNAVDPLERPDLYWEMP